MLSTKLLEAIYGVVGILVLVIAFVAAEGSFAQQDRMNQEAHRWTCNGPHTSSCSINR